MDGVQAQTGGPQCADRGEPGGPGATGAPELTVSAYPLSQAAAQAELPDDVPAPERLLRPLAGLPKDPEWRHFAETISRVNGYMLLPLLVPFTCSQAVIFVEDMSLPMMRGLLSFLGYLHAQPQREVE